MREVSSGKPSRWARIGQALDSALAIPFPALALKRAAAREMLALSGYDGARRARPRSEWAPGGGSADEYLLDDLPELRERSRDLNRNNGQAAGLTSTTCVNVVGTGIRSQSSIDVRGMKKRFALTEEQVDELQRDMERAFQAWTCEADAGERLDWYDMQQLAFRQILESGEAILIRQSVTEPYRRFSHCWQIVESDRLETPPELMGSKNVRAGVELGTRGQAIAYHIRKTHPGDFRYGDATNLDFMRIPARDAEGRPNILHLYKQERAGQTRGIPFFTPVLNYFRDLDKYMEAEIVAARVAACFAAFVKTTQPQGRLVKNTKSINSRSQRIEGIEPGMIEYLGPNEEIQIANPGRPGNNVDPFVTRMLRMISASLGLPYEQVAKDFSKTNFSSARAALIEAWRMYDVFIQWLCRKCVQVNWEIVMEEAFVRGYFELPVGLKFYENRYELTRARHIPPGRQWIDPVKEVNASKIAIESNLSTLAMECGKQGQDWEEILEQRAREIRRADELGLSAAAPAPEPDPATLDVADDEDAEDEDREDMEDDEEEDGEDSEVEDEAGNRRRRVA